jgi:hypothetical protein
MIKIIKEGFVKRPTILVANHIGLLDFLKIWLAYR